MRERSVSALRDQGVESAQADGERDELVRQAEAARAEAVDLLAQVVTERARVHGVVQHLPLGVVLLEAPAGRVLLANERAGELLGARLAPGDVWALPDGVVLQREDGTLYRLAELAAAGTLASGDDVHELLELRSLDRRAWIEFSSTSIRNERDEVFSVIVMLQDVTGRRRDEVRRRLLDATGEVFESGFDRRKLLRELVLRTVPAFADWAAVDVFEDGVVRLASAQAEHAGRRRSPAAGRRGEPGRGHVVERVRESAAPFFAPEVDAALAEEVEAETTALGSVSLPPVSSYICVPVLTRGAAVAAFSFATSGGERRFDEEDLAFAVELARRAALGSEAAGLFEQLEDERDRLGTLVDRFRDGVVAVTPDLVVALSNRSAQQAIGDELEPGRPLPEPWPEVFDLRGFAAELCRSRDGVVERTVSLTDGGRTLELVGIPARGDEAAVIVVRDVSERERVERAEREFVANAAHELRTPLTAITAAVAALELGAKDVPADRDRFLGHLARECDRLGRLSEALLVLARAQTGAEPAPAERIEVRPLFERIAADLRPRQGVELAVRCREGLEILANRALVDQAVRNVAENAAKFTTEGRIELAARTSGNSVVLDVRDTGPGIAAVDSDHVFERFFRRSGPALEGFGLGLAIVRESVRAAGGTVELLSQRDRGTTVRLTFARAEAA